MNLVYLIHDSPNRVTVIDAERDSIMKVIPIDNPSTAIAYNPVTNAIYVTTRTATSSDYGGNNDNSTVYVIDGNTQNVVSNFTISKRPTAIGVDPKNNKIYIAALSNKTFVVDGDKNVIVSNITVCDSPTAIAVDPNIDQAYVANLANNTVSVINTSDDRVIANITVGHYPTSIAVNQDTNIAYVASYSDNILSVIDGDKNTVMDTIKVGVNPYSLTVNPNTNRVYVAHVFSDYVSVIDGATNVALNSIPLESSQRDVAINPNTNMAYVTLYEHNILGLINGLTNTKMAGINLNVNPANAGKIICNDKEIVNNGYTRIDIKAGNDIVCQPKVNSGFIFSSWSGTIAPISNVNHTSSNSNFPFNFNFLSQTNSNENSTFRALQNGTLIANFLNPVQVSIPTEALVGIILSPFVGWLIPSIAQWQKGNRQSKLMSKYITKIFTMQTTTSQQHKDEYLKKLSDLKEEITDAYTKGKINQSHYEVLKEKFSQYEK